jgi:Flp pilus assembly protein TadG
MFKLINISKKQLSKMERGQVLVVVALAMVGLIAIMGLALDVGQMFIENARLRRAVDSAALAASLQIRTGYDPANLEPAAVDFLNLNGIHPTSVTVEYCHTDTNTPADLCPTPPRKLVRVTVKAEAQLNFLAVIGIDSVPITATATSETASIDMVLVLDRSESMTYDYAVGQKNANGDQMRDPSVCNAATTSPQGYKGDCEPFNTVKNSAIKFVKNFMFEPYDRVAVVSFAKDSHVDLNFSFDKTKVIQTISDLTVYQGDETVGDGTGASAIYPTGNPSRHYDPITGNYLFLDCPFAFIPTKPEDANNPSPCTTTNLGGGLLDAGREFSGNPKAIPPIPVRQNSLWVVVLLTDGVANAGYGGDPQTYYCPDGTWFGQATVPFLCNDAYSDSEDVPNWTRHHPSTASNYDAEDYAYDMADFVGKPTDQGGQGAYLYTIGLGHQVALPSPFGGTPLGEKFLEYAASIGKGIYYPAPTPAQLDQIFQDIANKIATILTK